MAIYELSFTETFFNESYNLPKAAKNQLTQKLTVLKADPYSAHGDAKKLKSYTNVYRARIGDYRLFYSIGQGWVKLLSVRKRDERTYEDDLPIVVIPEVVPDSETLEPQPAPQPPVVDYQTYHLPDPQPPIPVSEAGAKRYPQLPIPVSEAGAKRYPRSLIPDPQPEALPVQLTDDLLAQWKIPAEYWAVAASARTADDILELTIPERFLSRILDNLYPRPLEAIEAQPEFVLAQPEDVERFDEEDLSHFLLRLTPEQEVLVRQDRSGPTLVKGGPGTGKSTLALYRVKRLIEQGVGPILFTTYTNALVAYSEQLLTALLGAPPAEWNVKVTTVDSLAAHYFARGSGWPKFATEGQALDLLDQALRDAPIPAANVFDRQVRVAGLQRLGNEYLLQEFLHVIEAWDLSSAEEYLAVERRGRRTPLKSTLREAIWAVYVHWRSLMQAEGIVLNEQIRRGALQTARELDPKPYQALVVDEAQDLSPAALRMLLSLVPDMRHVYLTADAAQSIYQRGFSWAQVHQDLNMSGRTLLLRRNYRNTAQIIAACAAILDGAEEDAESIVQEPSAHRGDLPVVHLIDQAADEAAAIKAFFSAAARKHRLPLTSGAVLCVSHYAGKALAQRLNDLGLPAAFQSGRAVDITAQQVNVLTIHSAKGLEFPFVAVTGLEAGRFPRILEGYPEEELAQLEAEQRRLFFVGCTRAMRALLVCGSRSAPSPFLKTLQPPTWNRE